MIFKTPQDIYGKASFMGFWERQKFLNLQNNGLVIDGMHRISEIQSFMHCVVAAPSGRGKTSRFVIPNVLSAKDKSLVITDPSGEIYRTCSDHLIRSGFEVRKFDPTDIPFSDKYNPLFRCDTHGSIHKLAQIIVESELQGKSSDPFWNESAISLISIIIKCLKKLPQSVQTPSEIYRQLNFLLSDQDQVTQLMETYLDYDTLNEYKAFIHQDKTLSSIVATAKASLHRFSDPAIDTLTQKDTINIEGIREKPTALFLMIPDKDASGLMFLLTLFYAQLFSFCMGKRKGSNHLPVYLLLDEFGNLGKIPGFATVITTLRKWNCSVTLLLQDIQQITKVYGREDTSIILNGGCSSRLFFPGLSYDTCKELERFMGNRTIVHRKYDPAKWELIGQRDDFMELERPLMTAREINQLPDDRALFFHANKPPVLVKTRPWWKHSKFKKQGKNN